MGVHFSIYWLLVKENVSEADNVDCLFHTYLLLVSITFRWSLLPSVDTDVTRIVPPTVDKHFEIVSQAS